MFAMSLIALTLAGADPAVEARISRVYTACMEGPDARVGVHAAMMACGNAELALQDGRLNQAWVMVMKRLPAARKATLRRAQRTWIGERDAECALDTGGGQAAQLDQNGCLIDATIKRTLWLENYR